MHLQVQEEASLLVALQGDTPDLQDLSLQVQYRGLRNLLAIMLSQR